MQAVETALKAAKLPSLEWYDVLFELERGGAMRPRELRTRLLLSQYNLSRLLERMVGTGVLDRSPCPEDGRGQLLAVTAAGRRLRRRMWLVYAPAIEDAVGVNVNADEAETLARLLGKLSTPATP